MTSAALLSLGFTFLFGFSQQDRKIRAVKIAKAALGTIFDAHRTGQIIPFLVHLGRKIIDFLGAIGDAKPTPLAKVFYDGNGHSL
jgi:hypothetical protein